VTEPQHDLPPHGTAQLPAATLHGQHQAILQTLVERHFEQAEHRVDTVYETHFASPKNVLIRHWRHRKDIPHDLLALPRSAWGLLMKAAGRQTQSAMSGKEQELRRILEQELLDLPGLERTLEQYCVPVMLAYQKELDGLDQLNAEQRQKFQQYLDHQLARLQLPNEGLRDGLMALTVMLTGKALGDKALMSSAASVGSTLAQGVYLSHQGWWAGFWAGWFGSPAWVSWAGAGVGMLSFLIAAPLIAPGIEIGLNRWRGRKLLQQAVDDAREQLCAKDRMMLAGQLALYLQLLPDLVFFLSRLRPR